MFKHQETADINAPNVKNWGDMEMLPVAVLMMNSSGDILKYNSEATHLLGRGVLSNYRLSQLLEGLGRPVGDWLAEISNQNADIQTEFLRVNRPDKEVFVQVTIKPVTDADKNYLMAVLSDATELKSLEAQFVQSQKMQAIGQLAGGIAHDFNNLLTAITGHCDLLMLKHTQGDQDYADLMEISKNAGRAGDLVGQLLAYSRKQTLRPEALDLKKSLSDLATLLNRLIGEKISLDVQHVNNLWPVRADRRHLEQVVMNLVVNARDAMPEGGKINICTDNVTLVEPLIRNNATIGPGQFVTLKLRDQGSGIDENILQKIFEPFYTTKRVNEGTGLGLSTAYGIIKQTGGFIFADNAQCGGAVFTIYLPVHEKINQKMPELVAEPSSDGSSKFGLTNGAILLVEDEPAVRAFITRALQLSGFTVIEASSGEEALEILSKTDAQIDIFVSDVIMPGLDGPGWVKKAQIERPDTLVVFVSGYARETFEQVRTDIPNSVFLAKPFKLNDLSDLIKSQLDLRASKAA